MSKILFLVIFVFSLSAFGQLSDPCKAEDPGINSWMLRINVDDQGSKEGLLNALSLVSSKGFSIMNIISYDLQAPNTEPSKTIVFRYERIVPIKESDQVKENTLSQLQTIKGNGLFCNSRVTPAVY